jgi:hypothetical protein
MPLTLKGEPISGSIIVGAHYIAWVLISLCVVIATGV